MSNLIVGLDLGTTKVCACAGRKTKEREIEVVGVGIASCSGLHHGIVSNVNTTVSAIELAMSKVELVVGQSIKGVVVGMSGKSAKGVSSPGVVTISKGREITRQDVNRVIETAKAISLPGGTEILHTLPQGYKLDGQSGIEDPTGMCGIKLECDVYIVTASQTVIKNLIRCVEKSGFEPTGSPVLGLLAASHSVLSLDEKNLGVVLIDIGGDTTDMGIFIDGNLHYTFSLPVGGDHITTDISVGLRTSFIDAEKIKISAGCCLASLVEEGKEVDVASLGDGKLQSFPRYAIAGIIEERMEEIFLLLKEEMKGFKGLKTGVVLTGGGALLAGTVELGQQVFNMPTRIGKPMNLTGLSEAVDSPVYAVATGLLVYGIQNQARHIPANPFSKIRKGMKNFFSDLFE
ncbi:cell division protein FtsA [bacterium]|nr:cell division protein FtsA [bacterium]MBU1599103.1 cell division protein FtsA [bacterium]MBU2461334.1 cell division protein FtsA [bacterium]